MPSKQPVEVQELRGAFIKDPQRRPGKTPKARNPVGKPYKWMTENQVRLWAEMVEELIPGVATSGDRRLFSLWVILSEQIENGKKLNASEVAQYRMLAGEFGASPVARTRLAPTGEAEKDDLEARYFDEN